MTIMEVEGKQGNGIICGVLCAQLFVCHLNFVRQDRKSSGRDSHNWSWRDDCSRAHRTGLPEQEGDPFHASP